MALERGTGNTLWGLLVGFQDVVYDRDQEDGVVDVCDGGVRTCVGWGGGIMRHLGGERPPLAGGTPAERGGGRACRSRGPLNQN